MYRAQSDDWLENKVKIRYDGTLLNHSVLSFMNDNLQFVANTQNRLRRTKIIATLGPSTDEPNMLRCILEAGVNLVRINLSHGTIKDHTQRIEMVRLLALSLKKEIGIIADLQGPKIRIGCFKQGHIFLKLNDRFILDADYPLNEGTEKVVGLDYKHLSKDLKKNDTLLLDDGLIVMLVEDIQGNQIHCRVQLGGKLSNHKGINKKGGGLSADPLTAKDKEDILFAAKMQVDYVAISFPRSARDVESTRTLLTSANSQAGVLAKIERIEAVDNIDEIILSADGVMVARGDLGVEIGFSELPFVQKHIISRARALDKPVITATQMMESMVQNPIPTRAEVSDVANAVLDGTDAVMLSAETATGNFPDKAVQAMHDICLAVERQKITQTSQHRIECRFHRADEAIAMAAMYAANHIDTRAIIALTETGSTPLWMSRIRSGIPIYGLSRNKTTRGRMTLYRGVYPIDFDVTSHPCLQVTEEAIIQLKRLGAVKVNDRVIITKGDIMGYDGGTNTLKIVTITE